MIWEIKENVNRSKYFNTMITHEMATSLISNQQKYEKHQLL